MIKQNSKTARPANQGHRRPGGIVAWLRLQRSIAEKTGLAIATFEGDNSLIGPVENDNSICQAMMASPEHARLCASDCGSAWSRANASGKRTEFQCHAGLHCFALPITIDGLQTTVLGGRTFTSSSEYRQFLHAYSGFSAVETGECLSNIKFSQARELDEAAELVLSTACYSQRAEGQETGVPEESPTLRQLLDAHRYGDSRSNRLEIVRAVDRQESKRRLAEQLYELLRDVASSLEPKGVYDYMLAKVSELMKAGRSSLLILNDEADELTLEATIGFRHEFKGPVRVKLGEPVAGAVVANCTPMIVSDAGNDPRVPGTRREQYKTKSFISFPISLGSRRLGVINLTDRIDGLDYNGEDLSLVELVAPHLALVIDRAEWRKKAEQFQQMSLTDALTGLPNRRYLEERLFEEVERSKRHGTPLSFMIIDIDRFKTYNDFYGHTNADNVLVRTAQTLRRCIRAIDMSSRFAGDEFCIVLPETEVNDAVHIAERLRNEVSKTDFRSEQGEPMGKVTISIGLSAFSPSRQSPLAIIETADRALYQAKTRGRNCVVIYEGTT